MLVETFNFGKCANCKKEQAKTFFHQKRLCKKCFVKIKKKEMVK